jgi:hypothetical protein
MEKDDDDDDDDRFDVSVASSYAFYFSAVNMEAVSYCKELIKGQQTKSNTSHKTVLFTAPATRT